jgi:uncharacterized membrane protein
MRRVICLFLLFTLIGSFYFNTKVFASSDHVVVSAKILDAGQIIERDGLRLQNVTCEIKSGEYKGSVKDIQVSFENTFLKPLKPGDTVKVSISAINGATYFQFDDFQRSKTYILPLILFSFLLIALVGVKGLKTLIPSILLIFTLIIGIVPNTLGRNNLLGGVVLLIFIISVITAWVRLRHTIIAIVVSFSVVLCLLLSFLLFVGFSQSSYIVPFLGSVTTLDNELYIKVVDFVLVSIMIIPLGGVINASIQTAKTLLEEFRFKKSFSLKLMLKEGFRISQKISAGELNNLIISIIGLNIAGLFLIKSQYAETSLWDNGWVSLQILYILSAGVSLLLITPVTVFVTGASIGLIKRKEGRGKLLQRVSKY